MIELSILVIFLISSSILVLIRNVAHATYIWQIKEYRLDRIWSHLRFREEPSGRNLVINVFQYAFLAFNLLFFLGPNNLLLIVPGLIFVSYIYESFTSLDEIFAKKIILPKKSIRNLLIVSFSIAILLLINLIPLHFLYNLQSQNFPLIDSNTVNFEDFLVQKDISTNTNTIPIAILILFVSTTLILATDLISPAIVSLFVLLTEPLAQFKRWRIIKKAKNKIKEHKGFKVVAITGSYGKSTTKELLFKILDKRFKVAKTDENFNSHVGIAQEILKNLTSDTEVFIAEMGAYNRKDIIKSTKILQPDVSVVTGITTQHLSLFKTIQKLVKAKYEIIKALKPNGFAVFNGNNEYCLTMASNTKRRKCIYYVNFNELETNKKSFANMGINHKKTSNTEILFAFDVRKLKSEQSFKFKLRYNNTVYNIKASLIGKHNIENLLAAIACALELNMDIKDIVAKINVTKFKQIHLKWFDGVNNSKILDDSYNSNPNGFKQALDILKDEKANKKIVVTKGIIELGKEKSKIYKILARRIIKSANLLITSDKDLAKAVFKENRGFNIIYTKNARDFVPILEQEVKEDDVVLLEGAMPAVVRMYAVDSY